VIEVSFKKPIALEQTLSLLNAVTKKLADKDASLWGQEAQAEANIRLNWVDLPQASRDLLPQLDALTAWSKQAGHKNVILAGMGGSSLAPEVIAKTYKKSLTVLDTTDPDQIKAAIPSDLSQSVIVVGSKSGSTIETASHKALFTKLITDAGLNPANHLVIVTDPGSPLDKSSRADLLKVVNADPNVGGRYSALSAFGLVPAALIGVDASLLIDDAHAASLKFTEPNSVPVQIAAALFDAGEQSVAFFDAGSQVPGLSDWIEQLIAESTGKNQTGRLPIVIESAQAKIGGLGLKVGFAHSDVADIVVDATLGEQFILWEWVTALLSYALKVDPFNQPNVTEAKERTGALLAEWSDGKVPSLRPTFEDDVLAIYGAAQGSSAQEILNSFIATKSHYVAIMAYLARGIDDHITELRPVLAEKMNRAVTFGWGPRFLHSTGQFHKGGQHNGAFLQITGENIDDIQIPGQKFSFHTLLMAQALGDGQALGSRDFPVLRIHLKNRKKGITQLIELISKA
jgi:glucose-6-phosphate isomerase